MKMSQWIRKIPLLLVVGGLLISACGESIDGDNTEEAADPGQTSDDSDEGKEGWPETISYGLLPTDDMDDLVALYTPFEEYMASCLDHPFELFPGTDYTAMVEGMRTGQVHISRFGPFSYILAHERAGAEALAVATDVADTVTYQSLIITLKSHGFESLEDLEGTSFAFVDPASSSGHLYPRALIIRETGITNEEVDSWFGDVAFAGNHEASLLSVLNEDADAGAIASNGDEVINDNGAWVVNSEGSFADHENADDLVVLDASDDIPSTVEAVQKDLPDSFKQAVLSCFEEAVDEPSLAEFREEGGIAAGYVPASDSDYDVVRDTADSLGMSPEDLLGQ